MATRTPVRTISRMLRSFFEMIEDDNISQADVHRATGHNLNTLFRWRAGQRLPDIFDFENMVEAAGYELILVRKENDDA